MKVKLKPKHWKIAENYILFSNEPNTKLTEDLVRLFVYAESHGFKKISKEQRKELDIFYGPEDAIMKAECGGKGKYNLQKKMVHEQIIDFWTKGWGWYIPLASDIEYLFRERHARKNNIYLKYLISIARKMKLDTLGYFLELKGSIFSPKEINSLLVKLDKHYKPSLK